MEKVRERSKLWNILNLLKGWVVSNPVLFLPPSGWCQWLPSFLCRWSGIPSVGSAVEGWVGSPQGYAHLSPHTNLSNKCNDQWHSSTQKTHYRPSISRERISFITQREGWRKDAVPGLSGGSEWQNVFSIRAGWDYSSGWEPRQLICDPLGSHLRNFIITDRDPISQIPHSVSSFLFRPGLWSPEMPSDDQRIGWNCWNFRPSLTRWRCHYFGVRSN